MAIVRVPKVNNYTIMSNHHLIDPELSFKAKGLMSYMLSRPDNWDFTIEGLAHQNKEGADAIARRVYREEAKRIADLVINYDLASKTLADKGFKRGSISMHMAFLHHI